MMTDKDKEEELRRQKEAELFSKTMGFTHTPSAEELERTVILNPITRKPEKPQPTPEEQGVTDFESTVRFTNFEGSNEAGSAPADSAARATAAPKPQQPAAKPAATKQARPQTAAPAQTAPEKPTAKPTPPQAPQAQKPAPQAAPKAAPSGEPAPKAAPTQPTKPASAAAPEPAAPAAPVKASETPMTPPSMELDFSDEDLELADIEFDTVESSTSATGQADLHPSPEAANAEAEAARPAATPPKVEPEAEFDSGAALDELDELLKMDLPGDTEEDKAEAMESTPATATEAAASEEPDLDFLNEDEGDMDMTVGSMPTVQLGADDLSADSVEEEELLSPIEDEELAAAMIPDTTTESVEPDITEPEELIDLSGLESSLDEAGDAEQAAAEEEPTAADAVAMQKAEPEIAKAVAEEPLQGAEAEATETGLTGDKPKPEEKPAEQPAPGEPETPVSEPQGTEPKAPVTAAPEAAAAQAMQAKRGGSGFAIFLSLVAIAGVGGLYWLNQGAGSNADLEQQLALTADRISQLENSNRRLAADVAALKASNEELKQQLGDLTRVVANRQTAAQKKAVSRNRPVIKPATPVKSEARPAPKAKGWVINLTSVSTKEAADEELARLKELGIQAEAVKTQARGKTWYRLRIPGFATLEEAEARSAELGQQLGIEDIWVGKP